MSWWPSWLDCGSLINVDAPGCGTWFEVRQGTSRKVFILENSCTQRFPRRERLLLVACKSLCRVLIKEAIIDLKSEFTLHKRGPLERSVFEY